MESVTGKEPNVVVFFDCLFVACVIATFWFVGYVVYRLLIEKADRD